MGRQELHTSGKVSLKRAIEHVEEILEQLKSGSAYIASGEDRAWVNVPDKVDLELSVQSKEQKGSLTLAISWRCEEPEEEGLELVVSGAPGERSASNGHAKKRRR